MTDDGRARMIAALQRDAAVLDAKHRPPADRGGPLMHIFDRIDRQMRHLTWMSVAIIGLELILLWKLWTL
jgi:hypothetical protein